MKASIRKHFDTVGYLPYPRTANREPGFGKPGCLLGQNEYIYATGFYGRICSTCDTAKEIDCFRKRYGKRSGEHRSTCKSCELIKKQKFNSENRKRLNLDMAEWRKLNPERDKATSKRYYSNPKNAPTLRARSHIRRARERNAEGKFTAVEWLALCEKYNNMCLACEKTDVKLTMDHVVPLARGGSNFIDNIQPLCASCNFSKNAKTIDYRKRYIA